MRFRRVLFTVPVLAVTFASPMLGQTGRGTLTGAVTDAQGRALQGAQINVDPGNVSAVSDVQGLFTLTSLKDGELTITVTYSGFSAFTQKVNLGAGQAARVDASLTIAANTEQVDVYAGRQGGEVEAINRTFTADNIINVLPADVITSLPNANVADAIGRLPSVTLERDEGEGKYVQIRGTEPRLTHTTLNGVQIASPESVRQIKLDLIPADLVESVQINKTLQANLEGDGIGGSVDLRTKNAADRPTLNLEALGGYTPIIGGRPAYQFDATVGQRFLGDKKLGLIGSGSYDWNGRGINDLEPGPALSGTYDLRDYRYFRDRRGFAGGIDYRLNDTSNLYFKGLYSHFNNFGDDWIYTPSTSFASPGLGDGTGQVKFQALRRRPVQDIGGLLLGGNHIIHHALFTWDTNASVARTRDDGYSFGNFAPAGINNPLANGITFNLDVSHPLTPHLDAQNGVNIFDPTQYFYTGQQVQNFYSPEVDLGFGASLSRPYSLHGHASTFELGGRFRNEHKFANQDTRNYKPNTVGLDSKGRVIPAAVASLAMTNFLNDFSDANYYGGTYKFGPAVEFQKLRSYADQSQYSASVGNSFNQIEKVSAGYLMNTTNLGKFRLVLGVRIEATGENNLGYIARNERTPGAPGTPPVRNTGSYIDVLPSASLRYALTPTSGLRLVYGRGLSRPNFADLIPFQSAPSGGNARDTISQGNPNLKSEYADNIDLLYENSLPHTGLLQAGFFYKNLSNPIVSTTTFHAADNLVPAGPYFLNQTINAGSAYVYGFEVAFQQHFTYLPGMFNGLGLSTNYGYTGSQAKLPPYIDVKADGVPVGTISGPNRGPDGSTAPLLRQSPNTFNFSPTYDKRNLSVRLGMTYNQAEIYSYGYDDGANSGPINLDGSGGGLKGPNGDTYLYSHLQLDLQGTYTLPKGFTAVAYALNLNNEVFGFFNGSTIYPIQREFYKQTFGGGLRWSPVRERK